MVKANKKQEVFGELPRSKLNMSEIFIILSKALDMNDRHLFAHSRRVAYITLQLGRLINLEKSLLNSIVLAALIHDIGINDPDNKLVSQNNFDLDDLLATKHCQNGYQLIRNLNILPEIKDIILYHHHKWEGNNFDSVSGSQIPIGSRIIFLADRIDTLIEKDTYILFQIKSTMKTINDKAGEYFDPELVEKFSYLAEKEAFWLNLSSDEFNDYLNEWGQQTQTKLLLGDLEELASIIAQIIDRISPFTSRHSTGVATIAAMLTHEMGYTQKQQRAMRIAGLIHDLGKLLIPEEIIEKKAKLNLEEFQIIKQHSYYTYKLLNKITGLGNIPEWAAFHHEKLDGSGYPYHLNYKELNVGSKIMAISDIFQALTEERPYRPAFSMEKALSFLEDMEKEGKIDSEINDILKKII